MSELSVNRSTKAIEFAHNLTLLNRVNRIRSLLVIFYFAPLIVYLPVAIFMGFITNVTAASLDAIIIVPIIGYCAWQACYRYRDIMAILVISILGANQLLLWVISPYENRLFHDFKVLTKCFWIHLVLFVIVGTAALINLKVNMTYHKLETCDGFPHFNERFFDQEMDRHQYGIKDPYQQKVDNFQRTASDEMSDIVLPDSIPNSGSSGTMDEI
ncbi:hypothetical protein SAMN02910265_01538 [Ruminococcus flavefaciens]|uniref:Uncharacterized protein n=1 Tax=Ruminococcus flavefaciens TaxID=1265 RepID=A0A1H6JDL2_RUMFL|nr:hypothetical protein [Ruminococcus flavefaciens]SEH57097.1 hypothetical protein SAMN02910265_01538 [Ruminococcus flavefaciens]